MKVFWAFARQSFQTTMIYRFDFWLRVSTIFMLMYSIRTGLGRPAEGAAVAVGGGARGEGAYRAASWMSRMTYGFWPQVKPAFWSIALFRWDINVRESAVLGLVGAGGIGMALDAALNLFQWDRVALILIAIVAVVVMAEIVVTQVRKRVL